MTEESPEKWPQEFKPAKGMNISTSTSSFEALNPHDPNLSRLATSLFQKTSEYLTGELTATQDHYVLLEDINQLAITKYADLRQIAANLGKTINEYNEMFSANIAPLLQQIDLMEARVTQFEGAAYRLDAYTRQLRARFKELDDKRT
ncbi:biogenesis of lysosome-related organelles complex 1 subunit 2 isoform X2 [Plutella xylostella]|uniref:biogenesis of lysosome-related organelles complex 1 subunit 2 isoform X1 n=1 Tax=Plutella xylostella TaxID=51655 RepID=UPI002032AD06|nr:biogenesis of lysosome-related organelles complex 1 subunit 2 isoform X1 [Plutella xylostella]XP_048488704.1 biogenesis of lysosome-related organelles complex 1 subunit 2 isoform X2 [Plutella xylostella]